MYTVLTLGLLRFAIFANFRKNTPKNTTKLGIIFVTVLTLNQLSSMVDNITVIMSYYN